MPVSSRPDNGFRIYRSTDDTLRMDALINGSAYAVVVPDGMDDAEEGYYDTDMNLLNIEADDAEAAPDGKTPEKSRAGQGQDSRAGARR